MVPYSTSTGYGTPVACCGYVGKWLRGNSAHGTGNGSTILGGAHDLVVDASGNIWFPENNARNNTQYVAVYVRNGSVVQSERRRADRRGSRASMQNTRCCPMTPHQGPLKSIALLGGFIWVMDDLGELWRIDPSTGNVSIRISARCTPARRRCILTTLRMEMTDASGTNLRLERQVTIRYRISSSQFNSELWLTEDGSPPHLVQVTVDTRLPQDAAAAAQSERT